MKKLLSILAVSVFAFAANAGTLDDVKNRGFLKCGVTTGLLHLNLLIKKKFLKWNTGLWKEQN